MESYGNYADFQRNLVTEILGLIGAGGEPVEIDHPMRSRIFIEKISLILSMQICSREWRMQTSKSDPFYGCAQLCIAPDPFP